MWQSKEMVGCHFQKVKMISGTNSVSASELLPHQLSESVRICFQANACTLKLSTDVEHLELHDYSNIFQLEMTKGRKTCGRQRTEKINTEKRRKVLLIGLSRQEHTCSGIQSHNNCRLLCTWVGLITPTTRRVERNHVTEFST